MRLLVQRVSRARVEVEGRSVGQIGQGLLALAGFGKADTLALPGTRLWNTLCAKLLELRIFPDDAGKLNLSLADTGGGLLLVSQFTLYADTRRGRRPSFTDAAPPDVARALFERLATDLAAQTPGDFAQGVFGAEMLLDFVNWGPVTILLDSDEYAG
ncbi:MAG: D-aminoacyl-tRNA deacylase [Humidesulfovibrio sp.]|uniref:D-aminoacyl-tRNA deacylase n=1 Tax=Humidesulfovibrio sp. TaxID=2910988 RepID=UPI0027FC8704|nr:D-aminoacyl-tRNA deacylase [Humidesulfovibrio sp.]MDQ7834841.1 D-aminoacyl-tRNA deacylase [Humidesulfovibrio sp.]